MKDSNININVQLDEEKVDISLDASPDTAVTKLPSYRPEDYLLLARFAVHVDFRANGLGAAMMRSALRLAAFEGKKGIFLYSAADISICRKLSDFGAPR